MAVIVQIRLRLLEENSASRNNGREKGESVNSKRPYYIQCVWFSHKFIDKIFDPNKTADIRDQSCHEDS